MKNFYHFLLSWLGDVVYRHPSREIFVVGITGTKGKTTCVELFDAVLAAAGKKVAFLSSVHMKLGGEIFDNPTRNSTPGRFFLKRFLRQAVKAGCEYVVLEMTSQAVTQFRHRFIDWDVAVFLDIHPEHIESHGSYENYRAAKVKFFADAANYSSKPKKVFFINRDDKEADYFVKAVEGKGEVIYFSNRDIRVSGWLDTDFNKIEAAVAEKFGLSQGILTLSVHETLNNFKGVSGRMEVISETPFKVVVDYAHTPGSLEAVYKTLATRNKQQATSKLICLLGAAGGGRDKWKRSEMGKIAAEYCDYIVLTDEDPYDEDPAEILLQIKTGISKSENVFEILDRKEAIKKAISLAKEGDVVILTGKGSEKSIHVAYGKTISWSEREVVEEVLKS